MQHIICSLEPLQLNTFLCFKQRIKWYCSRNWPRTPRRTTTNGRYLIKLSISTNPNGFLWAACVRASERATNTDTLWIADQMCTRFSPYFRAVWFVVFGLIVSNWPIFCVCCVPRFYLEISPEDFINLNICGIKTLTQENLWIFFFNIKSDRLALIRMKFLVKTKPAQLKDSHFQMAN